MLGALGRLQGNRDLLWIGHVRIEIGRCHVFSLAEVTLVVCFHISLMHTTLYFNLCTHYSVLTAQALTSVCHPTVDPLFLSDPLPRMSPLATSGLSLHLCLILFGLICLFIFAISCFLYSLHVNESHRLCLSQS